MLFCRRFCISYISVNFKIDTGLERQTASCLRSLTMPRMHSAHRFCHALTGERRMLLVCERMLWYYPSKQHHVKRAGTFTFVATVYLFIYLSKMTVMLERYSRSTAPVPGAGIPCLSFSYHLPLCRLGRLPCSHLHTQSTQTLLSVAEGMADAVDDEKETAEEMLAS